MRTLQANWLTECDGHHKIVHSRFLFRRPRLSGRAPRSADRAVAVDI
jgi:hypothetical protein